MKTEKPIKRIVVVRLYGIGNALLAIPFCRILKKTFPGAHLSVISDMRNAEILRAIDVFNEVCVLPPRHSLCTYIRLFFTLLRLRPDTIFSLFPMYHTGISWMYRFSGATRILGHDYDVSRWCYTKLIPFDQKKHESMLNIELLSDFFREKPEIDITLPISDAAHACVEDFFTAEMISNPVVVIHCGAHQDLPQKRWPCQSFALLADRLHAYRDMSIVFVGGEDDRARVSEVRRLMTSASYSCVGEYDIMATAALLSRATVVIANDSGIMHIASACQVPVIGLFGPTDPIRVAPLGSSSHVIQSRASCVPCHVPGRAISCVSDVCMKAITVDEVFAATCRVLNCVGAIHDNNS